MFAVRILLICSGIISSNEVCSEVIQAELALVQAELCDCRYHLPITIAQLALFIAYLQNKSFAARTISTYVSALGFIHKINKLPDPTEAFLIEKPFQSVPKQKRSDSRLPITSSILNQLVNALRYTVSSKFDQILLTSMLTLTYHGLLRIGEMTVNNNSCINVLKKLPTNCLPI
jgi:hypothetical protein